MSAENITLDECELVDDSSSRPAVEMAADVPVGSETVALGSVDVQGVEYACVAVVFPRADVAALNVGTLGSAVRNALLSVS